MPVPLPAAAASSLRAAGVEDMFYPCSDGRPMAENMWQSRAIVNAVVDIEAAHPQALVAADILVYPEEGNKDKSIAPDVLVAFGLGTHSRSSYLVWAEGKPPYWVLGVASPSTKTSDLEFKRRRYAEIGVLEYWLFDAKGDVYPSGMPRLQGLTLWGGDYRPLASRLADGEADDPQRGAGLGRAGGWRTASLPRRGDGQGDPASVRGQGWRGTGSGSSQAGGGAAQDGRSPC